VDKFADQTRRAGWSYFQAVYFTFIVLVTVGYGDYTPTSNAGKAFFVIWSLLAVPALTVLVSNLGDTLVKTVLDWSAWVGRMTVLPDEKGTRYALRQAWRGAVDWMAGFVNRPQHKHQPRQNRREHQLQMTERVSLRLEEHLAHAESRGALEAQDPVERDIHFYHYVLAREIQRVQQDLRTTPPVQYSWHDWEFFLQLIGGDAEEVFPGMDQADAPFSSGPFSSQLGPASEPEPPIAPKSTLDGAVDRVSSPAAGDKKRHFRKRPTADMLRDWSWMSDESPLLSSQTESEWVVQRLSETLVRELGMQPIGPHRRPPVGMRHVLRRTAGWEKGERKL
jgi:potassium channel subfamily K